MLNLIFRRSLLLCCCALTLLAASSRHKSHRSGGKATQFDSYLFVLSWSPEYCQGHSSSTQCSSGKHFGFVVHGLWPEYSTGRGPENCSNAPGPSNPSQYLDIMPDLQLIAHEWTTHGTCSGLSADAYFGQIRQTYSSTKIPANFQNASQQFTTSPTQVSQQFAQANANLPASAIQLSCPSNYLSEVEICLDKSFKAQTCTVPPPCRAQSVKVPPIP